jgi:hypothetical protein
VGVLGAIGAGCWWFFRQPTDVPKVDPLAYVPTDAEAIAVVRLAEMWKKLPPLMNGDHDPVPDLEEDIGLVPEQIERVWFVWHRPKANIGWAVIRTTQNIDRDKLVGKLQEAAVTEEEGHRVYVGRASAMKRTVALVFLDNFTLLVGSEIGVLRALALPGQEKKEGPLADVLQLADQHDAVVGASPQLPLLELAAGVGIIPIAHLDLPAPFTEAHMALDVAGDTVSIKGKIGFSNRWLRQVGHALLQAASKDARSWLNQKDFQGGQEGTGRILSKALEELRLRAAGNHITIEGSSDAGQLVRALARLPRLLSPSQ